MKRLIWLLIPFIYIACSNDIDSNLRGQWQLRNIEINGKDSIPATPIYYCFQDQVFQIKGNGVPAYGRYYTQGDSLCIIFEDPNQKHALQYTKDSGWESGYRSFFISKLNDDQLYLNSKEGLLKFRIY